MVVAYLDLSYVLAEHIIYNFWFNLFINVCLYCVHMCVRVYVCMCACMCVCVCVCAQFHTSTYTCKKKNTDYSRDRKDDPFSYKLYLQVAQNSVTWRSMIFMMKMKDLSSFASRESGNEQKQALTAFFFLSIFVVFALEQCDSTWWMQESFR